MLVLSRKVGERIVVDREIVIEVRSVKGQRVKLALEAPRRVQIAREEILGGAPRHGAEGAGGGSDVGRPAT